MHALLFTSLFLSHNHMLYTSGSKEGEPGERFEEKEDQSHLQYLNLQQQHQRMLQMYQSPVSEDFDFNQFQSLERAKWYY